MQYDPGGKKRRNLYYHFVDEHRPDKLIAKIRKSEAHALSFEVSSDYKYLILRDNRRISIANIESLEGNIKFKSIFEIFQDASYVSNRNDHSNCTISDILILSSKQKYVGNYGEFFLFLTNVGAPRFHLIEIDIWNKKPGSHSDVVVTVSDYFRIY